MSCLFGYSVLLFFVLTCPLQLSPSQIYPLAVQVATAAVTAVATLVAASLPGDVSLFRTYSPTAATRLGEIRPRRRNEEAISEYLVLAAMTCSLGHPHIPLPRRTHPPHPAAYPSFAVRLLRLLVSRMSVDGARAGCSRNPLLLCWLMGLSSACHNRPASQSSLRH